MSNILGSVSIAVINATDFIMMFSIKLSQRSSCLLMRRSLLSHNMIRLSSNLPLLTLQTRPTSHSHEIQSSCNSLSILLSNGRRQPN